jgi:hypothetical protein
MRETVRENTAKTLPLIYKIQLYFNTQAMNKPKDKSKKLIWGWGNMAQW